VRLNAKLFKAVYMALNVHMITHSYIKVSTNILCEYYTVHSRNYYGYDHSLFLQLTNFFCKLGINPLSEYRPTP
jgi:hypothetical protein